MKKNRAKEYHINNRDIILYRAKEYYINNKQSIREDPKIKEYQNEYRKNMTYEKKQKSKNIRKNIEKLLLMNKNKDIKKLKINAIKINIKKL